MSLVACLIVGLLAGVNFKVSHYTDYNNSPSMIHLLLFMGLWEFQFRIIEMKEKSWKPRYLLLKVVSVQISSIQK